MLWVVSAGSFSIWPFQRRDEALREIFQGEEAVISFRILFSTAVSNPGKVFLLAYCIEENPVLWKIRSSPLETGEPTSQTCTRGEVKSRGNGFMPLEKLVPGLCSDNIWVGLPDWKQDGAYQRLQAVGAVPGCCHTASGQGCDLLGHASSSPKRPCWHILGKHDQGTAGGTRSVRPDPGLLTTPYRPCRWEALTGFASPCALIPNNKGVQWQQICFTWTTYMALKLFSCSWEKRWPMLVFLSEKQDDFSKNVY